MGSGEDLAAARRPSSIDVRTMLDCDDSHALVDPVEDPVVTTPSAVQPFEVEAQGFADALRVAGEWTVDELNGRRGHLFGQSLQPDMATLVAMTVDAAMALRDVKNRLSEVVDQVEREHDRVVITRHGKPAAVVISADDLESLEETLKVVSRPKLITQVRDSLAELAAGEAEVLSKEEVLATLRA